MHFGGIIGFFAAILHLRQKLRWPRSVSQIVRSEIYESTEKNLTGKKAVFTWPGPDYFLRCCLFNNNCRTMSFCSVICIFMQYEYVVMIACILVLLVCSSLCKNALSFYRAMHTSAKRSIAIACRLSVDGSGPHSWQS